MAHPTEALDNNTVPNPPQQHDHTYKHTPTPLKKKTTYPVRWHGITNHRQTITMEHTVARCTNTRGWCTRRLATNDFIMDWHRPHRNTHSIPSLNTVPDKIGDFERPPGTFSGTANRAPSRSRNSTRRSRQKTERSLMRGPCKACTADRERGWCWSMAACVHTAAT